MISKEFRQMRRDRRTVAMMVMMPVVLLLVFGYAASFDVEEIPTAVLGTGASTISGQLPQLFRVDIVDDSGTATTGEELLREGEVTVALVRSDSGLTALIDGSELFSARAAVTAIGQAGSVIPGGIDTQVLFNPELDTSAVLVPGLGGLILIFVGTLLTSLGVVRERQAGTLEQLAVMPFKARDVVTGKISPYFLVAAIDLVIVLTIGILLFNVPFNGPIWVLALGSVLFLLVTLGIGVLISTVSENQGQAIQLALMTLLPQVLLSGIIFPLSSMAPGVRWIGYLLPLTYFNQIAKGVMIRGAGLGAVTQPMLLLLVLGVVVFTLAIVRFARDLAPSVKAEQSA